jgi:hypothetical protein
LAGLLLVMEFEKSKKNFCDLFFVRGLKRFSPNQCSKLFLANAEEDFNRRTHLNFIYVQQNLRMIFAHF